MVGDPGIEPGVRLREGVTALTKHKHFNRIFVSGPKDIKKICNMIGTSLYGEFAVRHERKYLQEWRNPDILSAVHCRKKRVESGLCEVKTPYENRL